ncbi:unnamed protein product [Moneuplotes crassus]|uniref:Uncharacterized protein n=1 Tax=Euplotes crassus TaxID=5936 RepID=A0AAD1YB89_EUPCR|nr:unnamed protein product [Moneuplotes crassus]
MPRKVSSRNKMITLCQKFKIRIFYIGAMILYVFDIFSTQRREKQLEPRFSLDLSS